MIFQFPANIVCRKLGPCLWLPSLAVSWGIVTLGVGFTTSWAQVIACRILLGIFEVRICCHWKIFDRRKQLS